MIIRRAISFMLALSAFFIFSLNNAQSQTWTKFKDAVSDTLGLVHKIYCPKQKPATLIICSNPLPIGYFSESMIFPIVGGGLAISTDSGKTLSRALSSYTVTDILNLDNSNYYLATVAKFGGLGAIAVSDDNGKNWSDDFNLRCESSSKPYAIEQNPFNKSQIFTANVNTSDGVKMSLDTFYNTCQKAGSLSFSSRSVSCSPHKSGLLFAASENNANRGVYRSTDNGSTWEIYNEGIKNLRILSVHAMSGNAAYVYCGADTLINDSVKGVYSVGRGIFQSIDTGKTWRNIAASNSRIMQIIEHPLNNNFLCAAADSQGVFVSASYGWVWEKFSEGLPSKISVHSVAFPAWETNQDGAVIFAASDDGIYISKRIKTSVDNSLDSKSLSIKMIYPNPSFDGNINLDIVSDKSQKVSIELLDQLGRVLHSQSCDIEYNNINSININSLNAIPSGSYFIRIKSSSETLINKVSIIN